MNFSNVDIERYYDQTEVHYRMFWNLKKSMGLHYGIWNSNTKNIQEAILNVNEYLMNLGEIKQSDLVLDAGCGIGGSSIYLAKKIKCQTKGITLSRKQAETAASLAKKNKVDHLCEFMQMDYSKTDFEDNTFDIIWFIESFGSAQDKGLVFKELYRILKPGGKILMAETFKPEPYDIESNKVMQTMLYGWATGDILSVQELEQLAHENGLGKHKILNVSKEVRKSVQRIYYAGILGMIGTKLYNLFKKASYFSKIHYKTGLAQKKGYDSKKWGYYLVLLVKKD